MPDETEPFHVTLSKVLYPGAVKHPAADTATMLHDVELLKECSHCSEPFQVRMCKACLGATLVEGMFKSP